MGSRQRFTGRIVGVGTTSGTRIVVGRWDSSPMGSFADAMIERGDGHRILLATSSPVAEFIAATYTFDEVRVEPVAVVGERLWVLTSPSLALEMTPGARMPLGWLLRATPRRLATLPTATLLTDPVARVALRGVRTRGTAGRGRREFYAATDLRTVTSIRGSFDGVDLGSLAPVDPPCRFGFSSTPRTPSVTDVTTTIVTSGIPKP